MLIRRTGRPGLLGLAARTAVVAGTANAIGGSMARRQAQQTEAQRTATRPESPQPQAAAPASSTSVVGADLPGQLTQLADLHAAGILSDTEFASAKAKLLG